MRLMTNTDVTVTRTSWLPIVVVVLTQIQTAIVVNALTVSMAGITADLDTPATTVGVAITASTFAMAAFILLGAPSSARSSAHGACSSSRSSSTASGCSASRSARAP